MLHTGTLGEAKIAVLEDLTLLRQTKEDGIYTVVTMKPFLKATAIDDFSEADVEVLSREALHYQYKAAGDDVLKAFEELEADSVAITTTETEMDAIELIKQMALTRQEN
jgi:hypothetical protein